MRNVASLRGSSKLITADANGDVVNTLGITPRPTAFGLIARIGRRDIARMTDKDHPPSELPLPCVLDDDDIDRLLERLRAVHGEPRQDIAPGLNRQGRARKAA